MGDAVDLFFDAGYLDVTCRHIGENSLAASRQRRIRRHRLIQALPQFGRKIAPLALLLAQLELQIRSVRETPRGIGPLAEHGAYVIPDSHGYSFLPAFQARSSTIKASYAR